MDRKQLLLLALFILVMTSAAQAQIPRLLSYQGVLSDTLGNLKPDGDYAMTFRLYESGTGGSALWSEQKTIQVKRGLFSTILGDLTAIGSAVKFDKPYWLSIQLASDPEMSPRIYLTAVGYSLNAVRADTAQYARVAPQGGFVDSARIAGTVPTNSIGGDKWKVPVQVMASTPLPILTAINVGGGSGGRIQIMNGLNSSQALEAVTNGTGSAGYIHIENTANSNPALEVSTNGTGSAGYIHVENTANNSRALEVSTNGTSEAGYFYAGNVTNASPAIEAVTYGTAQAGYFHIENTANGWPAIRGQSNGGGNAVHGFNTGAGGGGLFQVSNASNSHVALEGVTNGTGRAGYFHIDNGSNGSRVIEGTTAGTGDGIYGYTASGTSGVYGKSDRNNGIGVRGEANGGSSAYGISGSTTSGMGVYGITTSNFGGAGVHGEASTTTGYADGVSGHANAYSSVGGRFSNDGAGNALWVSANGNTADGAALRVHNNSSTYGMAAYFTNLSAYHTAHFQNTGTGGVLFLQNAGDVNGTGGNDFITAVNFDGGDVQFKVLSSGEVRSDVGFNTPAADFAEMLPGVSGMEPGDVLVIGPEGALTRSTEPYQVNVAGVYSTQPGFTGGKPTSGEIVGTIPLAVVGVVPVKVTSENGPITPGDLLVSSSLTGYAMKAGANAPQGTVIGKALERCDASRGVIRVLAVLQ